MTSRRQNSYQYYQKQKMTWHLLQQLLRHLNPIHPWHINLKFAGVKEIKAIIIILKSLKLPKIEGKKGGLFPFKPWLALCDFKEENLYFAIYQYTFRCLEKCDYKGTTLVSYRKH